MQFAAVLRAICGGFAGKTGRDFLLVEVLSVKQRRRIGIQDHEGLAGSGFRITKGFLSFLLSLSLSVVFGGLQRFANESKLPGGPCVGVSLESRGTGSNYSFKGTGPEGQGLNLTMDSQAIDLYIELYGAPRVEVFPNI